MSALAVPAVRPSGGLARRNPAAKLVAATVPGLVAVATLDPVTPALLLAATLGAVPYAGLAPRALARRTAPLLLAAVVVGLLNAVTTARRGGSVLGELGPFVLSTDGLLTGLGITLRVLALALPGVLVLASTDPVDLADSLVRQLRVPARFAYGTLAALRLLPLLTEEWQTIAMARRARGVEAGRSPVAAVRLFTSQVLALLVVAIRRGTRLAQAMDARGFDSSSPRTCARPQRVGPGDVVLVVASTAASALAVAASVALGTWRPLLG